MSGWPLDGSSFELRDVDVVVDADVTEEGRKVECHGWVLGLVVECTCRLVRFRVFYSLRNLRASMT